VNIATEHNQIDSFETENQYIKAVFIQNMHAFAKHLKQIHAVQIKFMFK
jgi:hypothetical protein